MDGPVLLCGLGTVGWRVLDFLRTAGVPIVAVDRQADPADPRLFGVRFVKGDFREKAVLTDAGVRIVMRMFNQNLVSRLSKAVPNVAALSVAALSAPLLALTALTGDVLAAFPLGNGRRQVADPDWARLEARRQARRGHRRAAALRRPRPRARGAAAAPAARRRTRSSSRAGRPSGRVRRPRRRGASARHQDRPARGPLGRQAAPDIAVKICTLALVAVVLFSAAVYRYGLGHPWADALYRTISVIATGADMAGQTYEGWGKVFVSFLRIMGTALIAAFTAIVTNALLTARLGGAFEVRRIPDKGHVIVCGLGNVGFRVVEALIRMDERVVVVEPRTDNPFIATCRRQGVAVVTGDATVPEVLRQARVATARAVIVATSADLINLEIALLVAEIHPPQRVVVRIGDNVLAETVRQAASVKLALSVAELAAPAFVAALLGDRVQAMFLVGGRMLAVVEITVAADDPRFQGKDLKALAAEYRFVPVAIVTAEGKTRAAGPSETLQPGEHLTIVATLPELERIVRRETHAPKEGAP